MSWIQTASGGRFDLFEPRCDQIRIEDIATALSNICRFGGHTKAFYSVAQHCVLASHIAPPGARLEALLHDAAEAYVGDMVRPLKEGMPAFQRVESAIEAAIFRRFDLRKEIMHAVHRVDLVMLASERRDLLVEQETPWAILDGIEPVGFTIDPWDPVKARRAFLCRFETLQRDHKFQERLYG